jgi:hypothetical protein
LILLHFPLTLKHHFHSNRDKPMTIIKKHFIFSLILFSVIFSYCVSSKKNLPQDSVSPEDNWRPPPRKEIPLSPGTAKVRAAIVRKIQENDRLSAVVRIQQVLSYGPATPVLPVGSEITTELSSSLQEKLRSSAEFSLTQGDTVTITMKHYQHLTSEEASLQWRIIQIHE